MWVLMILAMVLESSLIEQYYTNFVVLKRDVSSCKVVISAILPRPVDFCVTKSQVIHLNKYFASLSLKFAFLFVRS